MIIVSQDRKNIVNFERIELVGLNNFDEKEIRAFSVNGYETLGIYESKERAVAVLADITMEYRKVARVDDPRNKVTAFYNVPRVFEMPKE